MNDSNNSNNSNKMKIIDLSLIPSLKIDHVHLKVSNLQNSIDFYQSILGFRILENKSEDNISYVLVGHEPGQDEISTLLVLSQIDSVI